MQQPKTFYEQLGGEETIQKLIDAFYPRVYSNEDLRPLFQDDIDIIKGKQKLFLTQFTGGPALYSEKYGAPMMKQRHLPFEITPTRAKAWLKCMSEAMDEIGFDGPKREFLYGRFIQVAKIMVNTNDEDVHGNE